MTKYIARIVLPVLLGLAIVGGASGNAQADAEWVPAQSGNAEWHPAKAPVPHVAYWFAAGNDLRVIGFTGGKAKVFAPCATEDSTGCYWNARKQGNGKGDSFVRVIRHGKVCTAYFGKPDADRCR
jgi:hypothetical protein